MTAERERVIRAHDESADRHAVVLTPAQRERRVLIVEIDALRAALTSAQQERDKWREKFMDSDDVNLVFCPKHADIETCQKAASSPKCQPCLEQRIATLEAKVKENR